MKNKIKVDSIFSAPRVLTCQSFGKVKFKKEMNDLSMIKNGSIAVKDGLIIGTGKEKEINKKYFTNINQNIIFKKGILMPGFCDPHTHLVFGGSRANEIFQRLNGVSYQDIHKKGGGILYTVNQTRKESFSTLFNKAKNILELMMKHGTTSVEIKSGYGLDRKNEIKTLMIIQKLKKLNMQNIASTFLGAHAIPEKFKDNRNEYIKLIINMLPEIKKSKLAEFVDVFCETGAFTLKESEIILKEAKKHGFNLKIHAEEFDNTGGAKLAGNLNAVSCDHLMKLSDSDIKYLKDKNTVPTLLPGTTFFLGHTKYAPARDIIDNGLPVALATDFNAGSCMTFSMQMIISLACLKMKMSVEEAVNASTINSAFALSMEKKIGSLEKNKFADMILLDIDDIKLLPFYFGTNLVKYVIKKGKFL